MATASHSYKRCTVHIFIDNSNLWIEGRKTYARKHSLETDTDPTWRFDVGRLKNVLAAKSHLVRDGLDPELIYNLYGSTPPPVDTVWTAISSNNVNVRTFERGSNNREKRVDHEIIADSLWQAFKDQQNKQRTEFMFVSGDEDMITSVERLELLGFTTHVWGWSSGMTSAYSRDETLEHVQVHLLDEFIEEIGFRETMFCIERGMIDPASIAILDPMPHADDVEAFIKALRQKMGAWTYTYPRKREGASDVDSVVIPAWSPGTSHHDKVSKLQWAQQTLEKVGLEVITHSLYEQRYLKSRSQASIHLKVSNRFEEMKLRDTKPAKSQPAQAEQGWQEVNNAKNKHRQRREHNDQLAGQRCWMGKYCQEGSKCLRGHTKEEHNLFKISGPKKARKLMLCNNDACTKGNRCPKAHSLEDIFCPTCEKIGHERGTCLRRSRS